MTYTQKLYFSLSKLSQFLIFEEANIINIISSNLNIVIMEEAQQLK